MVKRRNVWQYLKDKYRLLTLKRYTTIAGTLVFFLIMSIVPLTFLLTLFVGKIPFDLEKILSLPIFESVQDVIQFVQLEAQKATTGVSIVLLATTLYSSTNLFYQMRRSGEIIYETHKPKQGWRIRLGSLVVLLITILMTLVFVVLFTLGGLFFSRYLSAQTERIIEYSLLILLSFSFILLMNMYLCPYKTKTKYFIFGSIFTTIAWILAVVGFSFYLKISNMDKLYGALSTIIVFLLWLYVLMNCFIIGVILNSEAILKQNKRTHKNKKTATK